MGLQIEGSDFTVKGGSPQMRGGGSNDTIIIFEGARLEVFGRGRFLPNRLIVLFDVER